VKYTLPDDYSIGLSGGLFYNSDETGLPMTICVCESAAFNEPDSVYIDYTPHIIVASTYDKLKNYSELRNIPPFIVTTKDSEVFGVTNEISVSDLNKLKFWINENNNWLISVWNMDVDSDDFAKYLKEEYDK
jgi:hypothetical protein